MFIEIITFTGTMLKHLYLLKQGSTKKKMRSVAKRTIWYLGFFPTVSVFLT